MRHAMSISTMPSTPPAALIASFGWKLLERPAEQLLGAARARTARRPRAPTRPPRRARASPARARAPADRASAISPPPPTVIAVSSKPRSHDSHRHASYAGVVGPDVLLAAERAVEGHRARRRAHRSSPWAAAGSANRASVVGVEPVHERRERVAVGALRFGSGGAAARGSRRCPRRRSSRPSDLATERGALAHRAAEVDEERVGLRAVGSRAAAPTSARCRRPGTARRSSGSR